MAVHGRQIAFPRVARPPRGRGVRIPSVTPSTGNSHVEAQAVQRDGRFAAWLTGVNNSRALCCKLIQASVLTLVAT